MSRAIDRTRPSYRRWVLGVTSIGPLLASLTSGTLVIALPGILRDLHTDLLALLPPKHVRQSAGVEHPDGDDERASARDPWPYALGFAILSLASVPARTSR